MAWQRLARFRRLRWKLSAVFIVLAMPPLLAAASYLFLVLPANLEREAMASLRADQQAAADILTRHLGSVEADVAVLVSLPVVRAFAAGHRVEAGQEVARYFEAFARQHQTYLQVRYLDAAGREQIRVERHGDTVRVVSSGQLQDKSDRYYVPAVIGLPPGEVYVSPIDLNREHGVIEEPYVPVVRFGAPVVTASGEKPGLVIINVDLTPAVDMLRGAKVGDARGTLALVDEAGYYLVHPDLSRSWSGPQNLDSGGNLFEEVPALRSLAADVGGTVFSPANPLERQAGGAQFIAGYVGPAQEDQRWLLVASAPHAAVLAPAHALRLTLLGVFVTMALIGLGVIWVATDRLSRPARLLREGALRVGQGDFEHRIALDTADEFGEVARAFDEMAVRLADSYQTLELRVEERTRQLAVRDEKLRALNQIAGHLVEAPTVEEIGREAAEYALRLTGASYATIEFGGLVEAAPPQYRAPDTEADTAPASGEMLVVSILGRDGELGRIVAGHRAGIGRFDPVERELLETLASHVAVAIDNAILHRREREAVTRLEDLNQAKTDFVFTVSHQLRSPVAALKGYAAILNTHGERLGDVQRKRIMAIMTEQADHLADLVEDVLRASRIDAGGFATEQLPSLLTPLIEEVAAEVSIAEASAHRIELRRPEAPTLVIVDPVLLKQALLNLVGNAVKYSPPGTTVTVSWDHDPSTSTVRITIDDEGPGIPPADRERVFERFVRLPPVAGGTPLPGTGLGLYIARSIVEVHRGSVRVEDGGHTGARFVVRLPLAMGGDGA